MIDGLCIAATLMICIPLGGEVGDIFAPEYRAIGGLCGVVLAAMVCVLVMGV